MSISILSERGYQNWASWFVVYEWEDIISSCLNLKIEIFQKGLIGKIKRRARKEIYKCIPLPDKQFKIKKGDNYKLLWEMSAERYIYMPTRNIIPIFLDFPSDMVDKIFYATENVPVFFVTCKDIYNLLISRGVMNVRYMPLSISDKYYSDIVPKKIIDVIQLGRRNDILHDYMMKYCEIHPTVEYVYQSRDGRLDYISTIRGNIGRFETREKYVNLLSSCNISLVSTPCCDGGRSSKFGNIDFVTPRFYESAAFYCHMIGRYTENEEVNDLQIGSICPNVKSYKMFEELMDLYLNTVEWDWSKQVAFTQNNLTSKRAYYIYGEMEKILN